MHDHTTGGRITTADGADVEAGERFAPGQVRVDYQGAGRYLWIDASQGASGDMLLAALIDAGADAASVAAVLDLVAPGKLHLQWRRVTRGAFTAMKVDVIADEPDPPVRHLSDVLALLAAPGVPSTTRDLAVAAFTRLAEAEAAVHGTDVESVHFHEVGALDSIGDIVGACEAFRTLGIVEATSSVVALGSGTVNTQHGLLSVPPPAVLQLSRGWPVTAGGPEDAGELCTPTGMTLIRTLCSHSAPVPTMTPDAIGVGAGTRIRQDRAGVLRVVIGAPTADDASPSPSDAPTPLPTRRDARGAVHEVSANVDDMDPRVWPAVIDRVMDAGALDAWLTPVLMKKGRPAHVITALAPPGEVGGVAEALITHTSTIGVRISPAMHRRVLQRTWVPVEVEGHQVRIKVSGDGAGTIQQATAEFADVERLAGELDCPQRVALATAQGVAWKAGLQPGAPWPTHPPEVDDD